MGKKNDNIVGRSEGPIVGGGHQTSEQAEIVKQDGGGLTEPERRDMASGKPGTGNPAVGGSSGGHSDQIASRGPSEDQKVAGGMSVSEQRHGDEAEKERRDQTR